MGVKERLASATGAVLSLKSNLKGAQADADIKAVRLARETKGVRVNPGTGAKAKDESEKFGREVLMARARTSELKEGVKKRKKKYAK